MAKFKRGDRVVCISEGAYISVGETGTVDENNDITPWVLIDGKSREPVIESDLELINKENTMENEAKTEFIMIVKNTEQLKKGGVFKVYSSSFLSPANGDDNCYHIKPYDTSYLPAAMLDVLLTKKIAVPAVEFNPKYVTLEQNETLQKALVATLKAPKTVKKAKASK